MPIKTTRLTIGKMSRAGTDVAIDSAAVVLMKSDPMDVVRAVLPAKKTFRTIKQNLFWATWYNALALPIAAGIFYPSLGLLLNPMIASAAMSFSSLSVVLNALRLKTAPL